MRLLARFSVLLLLMGMSTGLLALQRGGNQQDNPYGDSRVAFSGDSEKRGSEGANIRGPAFDTLPLIAAGTDMDLAEATGPPIIPRLIVNS